MDTQLKAWGNSQGVRLPRTVILEANLKMDDILDIEVADEKIILSKKFRHKSLEERAKAYNNKLTLNSEIDWGEPQGREIW
ncbi:antitoxin MazE [Lachnospiraceae bacterium NK3A20]|jgi:antitoxin MazE|nr:antitoxin MazE [Lachnospiraceae bacterium NK3A20]